MDSQCGSLIKSYTVPASIQPSHTAPVTLTSSKQARQKYTKLLFSPPFRLCEIAQNSCLTIHCFRWWKIKLSFCVCFESFFFIIRVGIPSKCFMLIEGMSRSGTVLTKNNKIDICRTFPQCGSDGRGLGHGCHLEMPLWSRATFETCHALLDQVKQTEPRQCGHWGDSISPGLQVSWQRENFQRNINK